MAQDLQKALAIYVDTASGTDKDETPIKDKAAMVRALEKALEQARSFTRPSDVDTNAIMAADALSCLA